MESNYNRGNHNYYGLHNDRGRRQKSKITSGIKVIARERDFQALEFEKRCKIFIYRFNHDSPYMCKNCRNYLCEKNT